MNLFWAVFVPSFCALIVGVGLFWAAGFRLKFSKSARDLPEVHSEFRELLIEDFADLVCGEADEYINRGWELRWGTRRRAVLIRIGVVRNRLRQIALNGSLCAEVGRFHINKIEEATKMPLTDSRHLAVRLLERGLMCHFMAGVCLLRMYWLEFRVIAWPFALPRLAECFEVGGYDLAAWYGHMVEDVLELAKQDEKRSWLFENTLFALTGLIEMPEEFFRKFGLPAEDES